MKNLLIFCVLLTSALASTNLTKTLSFSGSEAQKTFERIIEFGGQSIDKGHRELVYTDKVACTKSTLNIDVKKISVTPEFICYVKISIDENLNLDVLEIPQK